MPSAFENNDVAEDESEWVDADSVNDIEATASTSQLWREFGEKTYQEWNVTVRRMWLFYIVKHVLVSFDVSFC